MWPLLAGEAQGWGTGWDHRYPAGRAWREPPCSPSNKKAELRRLMCQGPVAAA